MSIEPGAAEPEERLASPAGGAGSGANPPADPVSPEAFAPNTDVARRVERAQEVTRWLQETWRSLPIRDPRPPDEIVAYDEDGLPT